MEYERPYASERDDWIQAMVLAGVGCTMIPEYAVTLPGLVTRPLIEPEFTRTVKLMTVRGRAHSPAVGAFVREARRYDWGQKMRAEDSALAECNAPAKARRLDDAVSASNHRQNA